LNREAREDLDKFIEELILQNSPGIYILYRVDQKEWRVEF